MGDGGGLPVHRHVHRTLGSVYAYKSEIDAWRQSRPRARTARPAGINQIDRGAAVHESEH